LPPRRSRDIKGIPNFCSELRMIKLWSIAKNTFTQTIRQPVYGILILVTFAVLVLSLPLAGWTMSTNYHTTDQRMLETLGLSTLLISGLLIAAFSASSALSREIEDMTALTVISKPVPRSTFVLGKFAGVLAAVAVAFYLCCLVFLMTVRHRVMPATSDPYDMPVITIGSLALGLTVLTALLGNYFFGWPFVSAGIWSGLGLLSVAMAILSFVGKEWQIVPFGYDTPEQVAISGQLLIGVALMFMSVTIFVAVAIAASTRFGQVMTLAICFALLVGGTIHAWLFGRWQDNVLTAKLLGWTVANLTYFFQIDAMSKNVSIPLSYVALAAVYCALYTAGVLCIGIAMFERRELQAQGSSATMPGAVALVAWTGRAAAIAVGIAALVMVSLPRYHSLAGLGIVAAMVAAAGLGWLIWSRFGAGDKWAYWLAWLIAVLGVLIPALVLTWPERLGLDEAGGGRVISLATAAAGGVVILILLLPKTRHHFK